jgi:hypothetical protein
MKRTAALLCAALSFAAQPAFGQVAIGGGAGVVYGGGAGVVFGGYGRYWYRGYAPYFYGGYAPYVIVEPWAMAPLVPRIPDALPSCYRYGRCSPADMANYRYRTERLDRLAPTSPPDTAALDRPRPHAPPPPTAEQDIRPEFRGSSVVREEYRESGRPIDGRQ